MEANELGARSTRLDSESDVPSLPVPVPSQRRATFSLPTPPLRSPPRDAPTVERTLHASSRAGSFSPPAVDKAVDFGAIPDLSLPEPAIPTPATVITATSIVNAARRSLALFSSPRLLAGSPRTRFDLSSSASPLVGGQPLKPILNPPDTPYTRPIEYDITDQHDLSPPPSPVFAPRDDDEPHPERFVPEQRTPHPLYTPMTTRRGRRRRKARSVASGRTSRSGKSAKSMVRHAWRSVRKRIRRPGKAASSVGYASTSSSTSTSRSDESNSTWNGWRFWRNSSSGSSSSGGSDTDDEWEPPTPHFTLLTPCLSRTTDPHYPPHLLANAPPVQTNNPLSKPVFDLVNTSTIAPVLQRLKAYWSDRKQEDGQGGDIGETQMGEATEDQGYFPHANVDFTVTPAVTPGIAPSRKLRGEERAAKAERQRGGTADVEGGPAWWLDVMCPTVADMRELRKIVPLHPLTMEDIIHQDTREKIETFPTLGYYFVVFRALDESYFKYTSSDSLPANAENLSKVSDSKSVKSTAGTIPAPGQRGRVDIIEGVGGKEGVEGVGVGAVNLYLVVFRDGIISFHFEDISKHVERVQGKLQQFGATRSMSSNWIAYGLMDSIVDAFFPLINFVEGESNDVADFLADPTNVVGHVATETAIVEGVVKLPTTYDTEITGISVDSANSSKKDTDSVEVSATKRGKGIASKFKMATIRRRSMASVLRVLPVVTISPLLAKLLPPSWTKPAHITLESTMLVDASGFQLSSPPLPITNESAEDRMPEKNPNLNRAAMLKKIADTRKLVTGLSRLMGPKADVVRGLRKRMKHQDRVEDASLDISIYIGDLLDHSIAMQQSLNFYEAILSHDHLAYIGILRISLGKAKHGIDYALVKLYIITLSILPMNVLVGLFSLNVNEPTEGARYTHLMPDGTPAGFHLFYIILGGALAILLTMNLIVYLIFRSAQGSLRERRPTAILLPGVTVKVKN